jgi:predicted RNase H-like HicB family nuclease
MSLSLNTKKSGRVEFVVYYDFTDKHFVGVCLTFNIVMEGEDGAVLEQELRKAAELHIETVKAQKLSDDLLNRPAPKKYWDIYHESQKGKNTKGLHRNPNPTVLSTPYSDTRQLVAA